MKNIFKILAIALLFASCTNDAEIQTDVVTYKYELGFLQKFRNFQSTLVVTSNEPTTSVTFDSGEGTKVEGVLNDSGIYQFNITDIPITPSASTFYITITEVITSPSGEIISTNIVQDEVYGCGTHTAWRLDYDVATNNLISTPL